ncbi:MAG: ATP-binding protein [Salinirussus sp.]
MRRVDHPAPRVLSGLGVLFALLTVGEGLYVAFVANPLGLVWVAGLVTSLPFTAGLVYGGYWLSGSFVSAERYARVGYWCLGGLGLFLGINAIIMVTMPPGSGLRLVSWARWAATLGAGVGFAVGAFEARGIERAVEAERERVRAAEAEAREDLLSYLNATLRHEVLNTANVILSHAELALADAEGNDSVSDRLETIASRAGEMETVIEDVRVLLRAYGDEIDREPVDVTEMLAEEIDSIRRDSESVTVETSMPERAIVRANRPLRRAFANLLRNAVEHNDSASPRIEVTVRVDSEHVVVRIADNGPGVPDSERDALFDHEIDTDSSHGLGLLLTGTLIETYDGTIELTETGPEGSVFTIRLPSDDSARERPDDPDHLPGNGGASSVAGAVEAKID